MNPKLSIKVLKTKSFYFALALTFILFEGANVLITALYSITSVGLNFQATKSQYLGIFIFTSFIVLIFSFFFVFYGFYRKLQFKELMETSEGARKVKEIKRKDEDIIKKIGFLSQFRFAFIFLFLILLGFLIALIRVLFK